MGFGALTKPPANLEHPLSDPRPGIERDHGDHGSAYEIDHIMKAEIDRGENKTGTDHGDGPP